MSTAPWFVVSRWSTRTQRYTPLRQATSLIGLTTALSACALSSQTDPATTEITPLNSQLVAASAQTQTAGNVTTEHIALGVATTAQTLELARSLATRSDELVFGEVLRAQSQNEGPNGEPGIHTLVEMRVEQTLVGTPAETTSFWVHGGELNGRKRVLTGQATYRVGERLGVFLYGSRAGVKWPTEMGRGKWRLVDGGTVQPSVQGFAAVYPAVLVAALREAR